MSEPAVLEHEPIATDEEAAVVAVVAAAATPEASHARGTKSFTAPVELKAAAEGTFRATIATFNVMDKDGDVTVPGAFQAGQRVKVAAWGHNWGALPVGAGTIGQDKDHAWVDGSFFLDTAHGLDTYRTVKALGADQEWSYGFEVKEAEYGQWEGQECRFLRNLHAFEASPVMVGAGVNTRTDFIKSDKPNGFGLSFEEHSDRVQVAVKEWVEHSERVQIAVSEWTERAKAGSATRLKEGRPISEARRKRMAQVRDSLTSAATEIDGLLTETEPRPKAEEAASPRVVGGVDLEALKARSLQLLALYGRPSETTHVLTD